MPTGISGGNVTGDAIATQAEAEAGTALDKVMPPLRVAQAIAAAPKGVLLGTVTTPSGGTQTLSGLDLTGYKFLRIVFRGVTTSAGSTPTLRIAGTNIYASSPSTAYYAEFSVELASGVLTGVYNTLAAGALTSISNATTSIAFSLSTAAFAGGSIAVYGEK